MKNVDIEELNANEVLLDSMLFRMIQISENAKKLSDEYKLSRGNVPWNAIYGLRNRIVHDYGNVDLNVVFETLKHDIPELLEIIWSNIDASIRDSLKPTGRVNTRSVGLLTESLKERVYNFG